MTQHDPWPPLFGNVRLAAPAAALHASSWLLASSPDLNGNERTGLGLAGTIVWLLIPVWIGVRLLRADDRSSEAVRLIPAFACVLLPFIIPFVVASQVLTRLDTRHWFGGFLSLIATAVMTGAVVVLRFERNAPDAKITDLGDAVWWAIVTSTTVGYGDEIPITTGGRITGVIVMFVGLILFSAVTGLTASRIIAARQSETPDIDPTHLAAELRRAADLLDQHAANTTRNDATHQRRRPDGRGTTR